MITVGSLKKDSTTDRYVKVSNQSSIYNVSQYALDKLKLDPISLIKDNPLEIEKDKLQNLTVHLPDQEFNLEPKKDSWPELDTYIESLKTLTISGILDNSAVSGDKLYFIKAALEGAKEPVQFACVKPQSGKEAACVNATNNAAFNISNSTYQTLFDNAASKLKKPAATAPEEKADKKTTEAKPAATTASATLKEIAAAPAPKKKV